jgi:hypothetical protein
VPGRAEICLRSPPVTDGLLAPPLEGYSAAGEPDGEESVSLTLSSAVIPCGKIFSGVGGGKRRGDLTDLAPWRRPKANKCPPRSAVSEGGCGKKSVAVSFSDDRREVYTK